MNRPKKARILVAEDNDDNRRLLSIYLTREGYEVIEARDGVEALDKAHAEMPDLVLSDVQMPGLDGYSLCWQLKQDPETERIPVILITAVYTSLEDTLKGLHQGANDFISRPFRQSELLARVQTQLRIKELQDRLVQAERASTVVRMAVTLAHEISNPLSGILGYAEVLLREFDQDTLSRERLRVALERIREAATQIRSVLEQLRNLPQPEVYTYAPGLEGISLEGA
jgi:two-component system sensor histidine kinase/response regulator